MDAIYTAFPSMVKQGPDNRRLNKTTTLFVESQPLATPPIAQEYFEPGINTKLKRRTKPKVDFTLPSDMPHLPLGFVPTNQTPGANGEPPAIVPQKELIPADLMEVFAKIAAGEKKDVRLPAVDIGSQVVRTYADSMREAKQEAKVESMMRLGYTEPEVAQAMNIVRQEEAVQEARRPARPIPVEQAIAEAMGVAVGTERTTGEMEVQTDISREGGKEIYARAPRRTAAEVAAERTQTLAELVTAPPRKVRPILLSKK